MERLPGGPRLKGHQVILCEDRVDKGEEPCEVAAVLVSGLFCEAIEAAFRALVL